MKSALKLFVAIFFILAVIRNLDAQTCSIGGKVMYAHSNQPVSHGIVKLYNVDGTLIGTSQIGEHGDWIIAAVRYYGNYDVIGIANDEWEEDALPTGYPDKVEPQDYIPIYVAAEDLLNINIYIKTATSLSRPGVTAQVKGLVMNGTAPVADAMIFAKQGDEYVGFAFSNSKGEYEIKDLPVGSYTIAAHKIGSVSSMQDITLTEDGFENLSFSVIPKSGPIVKNLPYDFRLSQNYPNPFNPSTSISYSVPVSGKVALNVFNVEGKRVAELVNASQEAGEYDVKFDASALSSGVYFYVLNANGFTDSKKMILVK
jgi:hypothetical protein